MTSSTTCRQSVVLAAILFALCMPIASLATTSSTASSDDNTREFKTVMQKRGDTAVPVKFVMSVSGMGSDQQQEGRTQGTLVSADGLILVPGRVVSLDLGAFTHTSTNMRSAPSTKSGQFRVQLAGSDEWLPADLVTRDTELGIAWLRLRHPPGKLPFVEFNNPADIVVGEQLFTVMRTSDQFGSVPIVRAGYVLGQTTVPRPIFLIDGTPGIAFDGDGKPAGYVDVDLAGMMRSRSASGGIGMDYGDMVFTLTPAARVGRATAQAAKLPVVKSSDVDSDDSESLPQTKAAPPASGDKQADPATPASPGKDAAKDSASSDAIPADATIPKKH